MDVSIDSVIVCVSIFSCLFSVRMYYCTALSAVFGWICALQVFTIISIIHRYQTSDNLHCRTTLPDRISGPDGGHSLAWTALVQWSGARVSRKTRVRIHFRSVERDLVVSLVTSLRPVLFYLFIHLVIWLVILFVSPCV